MLSSIVSRTVALCTRYAWSVVAIAVLVTAACGAYTARHFAINTDLQHLISRDLPWRQREIAYEKAFPEGFEMILAVVSAPTPELANTAGKRCPRPTW